MTSDVQISVVDFEPLDAYRRPLEALGYVLRADNPERTKRYFRETPGHRRTHLGVRRAGSFLEASVTAKLLQLNREPHMTRTVEAVIDEEGRVRLLEPVALTSARRALVTILDEEPLQSRTEPALLSEAALAEDWLRPEEDAAWSHLQPAP